MSDFKRFSAVAAGAVALLAIGYFVFGGGDEPGPTAGTPASTGANVPDAAAITAEDLAQPAFAFRRLEIDTSKPQAEACLVFTRTLDASGTTRYEDYLTVTPEIPLAVRPTENRLCVAGFAFNESYDLELRPGLPSGTGETLAFAETVGVELRDRMPLVVFEGGILLPRENAAGVPVTTINVATLDIKLMRVGDRLLTQLETGIINQQSLYWYERERLENEQAATVWTGQMDVAVIPNQSVTTLIPIREMMNGQPPGAYVLLATDAAKPVEEFDYSREIASQWVIDSDIGLTTFDGTNGLSVFARNFSEADPVSGLRLTLVARNNNILQERETDADGRADFDPGLFRATGAEEPVAVMAYGEDGDFTYLDLRRPDFDFSDRGVDGRPAPGPVDAFLYTERGVYRPGEIVHAVAMLRDSTAEALSVPLTLVVTRPDGNEFRRMTATANELSAGAAHWPVQLTVGAPQGRWQMAAYIDPDGAPVGRVGFDVADFVPQRLQLTLTPETEFLAPDADFAIRIESRFLYGAPAAGLAAEGEIRVSRNPDPYPQYQGYRWGRDDETFEDFLVPIGVPMTDDEGVTRAEGNLGEIPDTSQPLKGDVTLSVQEPGGRLTTDQITLPVRARAVMIGLRPDFNGDSVAENTRAGFEAIAVNGAGERIAATGLQYEFVREENYYNWYQEYGEWRYTRQIRTRIVAGGDFDIAAAAPAELAQTLPWGRYRLTVNDPASGASTSMGFWSGWAGANDGARPDRVAVMADKESFRSGENARINIAPETDGKALIVIASEGVHETRLIDAPASGTTIDIPVDAEWGAGAYVLVTHYRPLNDGQDRMPVRSVGLVWLSVDNSPRTLTPQIATPDVMRPRQMLSVPISVDGLADNEEAYVTLAAVDEGIMQLTDYETPDPADYYFGKRRLGVGMRDDYGRLILADGTTGALRTGGDGFGGRGLAVVPTRTVALFEGPVRLQNGTATIDFEVPDFNGELRLVAVAFSAGKVGSADKPITVRDPVIADMVLPRFLAPGDQTQAAINLHNLEGTPGDYTITVSATGGATIPGIVPETRITRTLATGERVLERVPLQGITPGIAIISLALDGPNNYSLNHIWPIEIRPSQLPVTHTEVAVIQPGESWTPSAALAAGLIPDTASFAFTVSSTRSYNDVVGMLRWLDRYPFGCLEQTTSRAMPLLVFNDLAPQAGLPQDAALAPRIQESIDRILDMQSYSGGFGLWSPDGEVDSWLSTFAIDFLYQAKRRGFIVPDEGLRRAAGYLQQTATSEYADETARAYAFYVLAREGAANLSDLRYFADVQAPEIKYAIAHALVGNALAQSGDVARAAAAYDRSRTIILGANPGVYEAREYGSYLRDLAGVTALAIEGGNADLVPALLERSEGLDMSLNATTTQEKAWILRAAYGLSNERAPLNVDVTGSDAMRDDGTVRLAPSLAEIGQGLTLTNNGDAPVWRTVSVEGTADGPLPAQSNGVTLTKSVWTRDGAPVDLSSLRQNDSVIVVLEGRLSTAFFRRMAVIDLLPAGLEIETTLAGEEGSIYPFLGDLSYPTIREARDDRFAAALELGSRYRMNINAPLPTFKLAYVARAVSSGEFAMPAGVVEDMYAPDIMARTTPGRISIAAQ
jgi:uncharacterized protein YfaS (alpha-2-macroglobulin family)